MTTTSTHGHADAHGHGHASGEAAAYHSHRTFYFKIFAVLMILLVVTVAAAEFPLGEMNLIAALAIAIIKAALILMFFMHFKESDTLTWLVVGSTFCFFAVMIILTFNDYHSRGWLPSMPGK